MQTHLNYHGMNGEIIAQSRVEQFPVNGHTPFSDLTAKETPRVSAATFAYLGHCGGLLKQEPAVFRVLQENGG